MAIALVGYNLATGVGGPWSLESGRNIQAEDEVVLDKELAKESGLNLGAEVEILGQPFTVVGLSRETSSWIGNYVFVSRATAEALLSLSGSTSFYALRLPSGRALVDAANALEANVEGIRAAAPTTFAASARRSVGSVLDASINALLGIAVIVGIAVMGLTVYTAVMGRMREYGALKAIGSNNRQLTWLVLREALYRAVLGFLLGTGLSFVVAWMLSALLPRWNVLISPASLVGLGAAALGMTLAAVVLPLRRISRLDPDIVFKA
ncbi:MAG: ABC transporter permease [Anaerolineae bacterium]|nr:ABC transporter permease [Anaerolineae bacterium]